MGWRKEVVLLIPSRCPVDEPTGMVEIEYRPYQRIVVHEIRKLDVPEFFKSIIEQTEAQKQAGIPVVNWIDGIAFVIGQFPPTPETISESLKGIIHYAIVNFTETSFQDEKRALVNNREFPVRMIRAEKNPDFVELVRYLKTFEPASAAPKPKTT